MCTLIMHDSIEAMYSVHTKNYLFRMNVVEADYIEILNKYASTTMVWLQSLTNYDINFFIFYWNLYFFYRKHIHTWEESHFRRRRSACTRTYRLHYLFLFFLFLINFVFYCSLSLLFSFRCLFVRLRYGLRPLLFLFTTMAYI